MENRTEKIQKKSDEPWADLPQDILAFILSKFVYAADVIRFRAVCKNWYVPKDMITKYTKYADDRHLPWLCNLSWEENKSDHLECEVYDPYSRLIFQTSTFVENPMHTKHDKYDSKVFGYGSKQGWLIAAYFDNGIDRWSIFLYNPYSKVIVMVPYPFLFKYKPCFAAFSGNPVSRDFQFFVFYRVNVYDNYIARYRWNEDMVLLTGVMLFSWRVAECRGMQYMNEHLFCLFDNGVMKRFSFEDGSLDLGEGEGSRKLATTDHDNDQLWLAKGDGDLLVAVKKDFDGNFSTFCFDWSNMSWVEKDLPENGAIFISGDVATFVRPFVEYGGRAKNKNKGCNVYLLNELICEKEQSEYNLLQI